MSDTAPLLLATLPFAYIVPATAVLLREVSKTLGLHGHDTLSRNEWFGIKVRATIVPASLFTLCAALFAFESDVTIDALVCSHAFAAALTILELHAATRVWARIKKALVFYHFTEALEPRERTSESDTESESDGYIPEAFDHHDDDDVTAKLHDELKAYLKRKVTQ